MTHPTLAAIALQSYRRRPRVTTWIKPVADFCPKLHGEYDGFDPLERPSPTGVVLRTGS
jgi:hypothetical protein